MVKLCDRGATWGSFAVGVALLFSGSGLAQDVASSVKLSPAMEPIYGAVAAAAAGNAAVDDSAVPSAETAGQLAPHAFTVAELFADVSSAASIAPVASAAIAGAASAGGASAAGAVAGSELDKAQRIKRCQDFMRLPWGPLQDCRKAIVASAVGTVLTTGAFQWWKRGFSSHITRITEGGFGRETYTGGVDKLSHAYTFYIGTRLVSDALQWSGSSKGEALAISAVANAGTAYLIELFDGYSKKTYGFSREDLAADAVGILMGSAVVMWPDLDRKFAYRMRYFPKGAGGSANFIDSYEGQTYFLTARLSGFMNLSPKNPLRYLELVFGYRGTGFKPREGIPGVDYARHERRTYYGIGLNMEEILRGTLFRDNPQPTRIQSITEGVLTYVQLPGTVFAKTHAF